MKLEIEVSEADIKSAIERHVRSAIADKVDGWMSAKHVKDAVHAAWTDAVEAMISEVMSNHSTIRAQVNDAMVKKLNAQLVAAMRKEAA